MSFKSRTVIGLMVLAMFAGSLLTLTIIETAGSSILDADRSQSTDQASRDSRRGNQSGIQISLPDGLPMSEEQVLKVVSAFHLIQQRFYEDVEEEALIDGAINGMLAALDDPYSVYMDADEAERFHESVISSTFSGIGAEVTMRDGKVTVVAPIKGSPAEKAGIRTDDIVLSVNGESLEGLSLNEAVMKIRGPKGTKAKLEILRGDSTEPITIVVIRDDIDIETVFAEMIEPGIGKIEIRQFAQNTQEHFFEELANLEAEGITGLIIDVRNNPGGLLPEVVDMIHPFLPKDKVIVQVEDRYGNIEKTVSQGEGKPYDIVILTNKGSASASEILAGALQDHGVGIVIGEATFGKGTVQSNFDSGVRDGSSIKLTIAKWLTPNGRFIEGVGIEPDIVVEMPELFYIAPFTRNQVLQVDDNDPEVRKLQTMLNSLGYETDRNDGYFDASTEEALIRFQQDHKIKATGKLDEETTDALEQDVLDYLLDPENDPQLRKAIEVLKRK